MRLISILLTSPLLLGGVLAFDGLQNVLGNLPNRTPVTRPVYAIAHRVLMTTGVWDALNDGANALEIDMTPSEEGWYAQHDFGWWSRGDTAETMFQTIAEAATQGRDVTFVWLDLKGADDYLPEHGPDSKKGTIQALRELAAKYLEPVGVKVLYGFRTGDEKALTTIASSIKGFEAVNMNGVAQKCLKVFSNKAASVDNAKLVMSYGYAFLSRQFGNCHEDGFNTCTELRKAHEMNKFGKVFGWTSLQGQAEYVHKLFEEAGVDGMIYGRRANHYVSSDDTKEAAADILNWMRGHAETHHIATMADTLW
jgi:sphingomyelin phosphodiesterase D